MAGALKRADPNMNEETILMRALRYEVHHRTKIRGVHFFLEALKWRDRKEERTNNNVMVEDGLNPYNSL